MHEMLDKQSKKEAIAKREDRKKMVTQNVPPTVPGKQNCMSINVTQCAPNFTNAKILNFLRAELIIKSIVKYLKYNLSYAEGNAIRMI